MKDIEGNIIYIEASETEIKNLIKLYQVGAIPKTIARYADISIEKALMFIRMARTGFIRYLSEGEVKTLEIKLIHSTDYVKNDIESEWVSEDTYGGTIGKMPEFKVLWKNQMTIKEYLIFKETENGINETTVHRHKKQLKLSRS